MTNSENPAIDLPPESAMLRDAYKKSGLTMADLAAATGMSAGSVNIALSGFRYRDGKQRVAVPSDATLVKLAAALRIGPEVLRSYARDRAAELLLEAQSDLQPITSSSDAEAQATAAGTASLARRILSVFSTEELRAELERRDRAEQDQIGREVTAELAEDFRSQWT